MKRLFSSLWETIVYYRDQFRLSRDRRLSEGGIWPLLRVFFYCLLVTIIVGLSLLVFKYHAYCLLAKAPEYANGDFKPDNVFDAAYYLLFTNGGQNLFSGGSHFWGAVITTLGVFLIAYLTSALTSRSERRVQRFIDGESWYKLRGHIVIFGASDYLYSIISEKTKADAKQLFLIVTTQDVASIRREVFSFLEKGVDRKNFVFMFGDRTSTEDLSKLSLERAKEVFVIGDSKESDDIESYRDSNNMDCTAEIGKYLSSLKEERKRSQIVKITVGGIERNILQFKDDAAFPPLPCHVMFEYQTTFAAFQFCEIPPSIKENIDFRPFNYYDLWARKVMVLGQAGEFKYKFLDTLPQADADAPPQYISEDSEQTVHLIILGMTKMGIAMALQAAHVCHFPNFRSDEKNVKNRKRTRITFIDSDVDIERDYFKGRFPSMMSETRTRFLDFSKQGKCKQEEAKTDYQEWSKNAEYNWAGDENGWYDIEWEFIKGRIESDPIQDYVKKSALDKNHIVTIAICLPKSHQSIASAMYLPESVYTNCLQILTFQRRSGTIVKHLAETAVQEGETARYKAIVPFGMMDLGYDSTLEDDQRAMMISYVYDSAYSIKEVKVDTDKRELYTVGWGQTDPTLSRLDQPFRDYSPDNKTVYWEYPNYRAKWRTKFVYDKLSSSFNANTIAAKLRGIKLSEKDCPTSFNEEQMKILERVEHNRWNIEKMLTGFRALTSEEAAQMKELKDMWNSKDDEQARNSKKEWAAKRKEYKSWPTRAHLDICSVEELHKREREQIIALDRDQNSAIPHILEREKPVKANS